MGAGGRNFRVQLQRLETVGEGAVRDAAGHIGPSVDGNWTTVATRWAKVHPRTGREFYRAQQIDSTLTHLVEMDWDSVTKTITSKWRLKDVNSSRILEVISTLNVEERNRVIMLSCKEAV